MGPKKVLADILINVFVARGHVFGRFLGHFWGPKTLPFRPSFSIFWAKNRIFENGQKSGEPKIAILAHFYVLKMSQMCSIFSPIK